MACPNQNSHVPKFGNWDNDNVPYTAYFESARRERGGIMINPNDPMENPEAFNMCGHHVDVGEVKASHTHSHSEGSSERRSHHEAVVGNHTRRHVHHRSRGSQCSAESGSERSHSDHKRSMSKARSVTGSFSSSTHHRHRSGSHSFNDPHMVTIFIIWSHNIYKCVFGLTPRFKWSKMFDKITLNYISTYIYIFFYLKPYFRQKWGKYLSGGLNNSLQLINQTHP